MFGTDDVKTAFSFSLNIFFLKTREDVNQKSCSCCILTCRLTVLPFLLHGRRHIIHHFTLYIFFPSTASLEKLQVHVTWRQILSLTLHWNLDLKITFLLLGRLSRNGSYEFLYSYRNLKAYMESKNKKIKNLLNSLAKSSMEKGQSVSKDNVSSE